MGSKSLLQKSLCPENQRFSIVTCWFRAAMDNFFFCQRRCLSVSGYKAGRAKASRPILPLIFFLLDISVIPCLGPGTLPVANSHVRLLKYCIISQQDYPNILDGIDLARC